MSIRSLHGIVFAALLALSLVSATTQALAATRSGGGTYGTAFFDPGFSVNVSDRPLIGIADGVHIVLLGVTWE